jgi:hypothetical protein
MLRNNVPEFKRRESLETAQQAGIAGRVVCRLHSQRNAAEACSAGLVARTICTMRPSFSMTKVILSTSLNTSRFVTLTP